MSAAVAVASSLDPIREAMLELRILEHDPPRTRRGYRVRARWLELHARWLLLYDKYPASRATAESRARSLDCARGMRWAAAMVGLYGDHTWLEIARLGGARWDAKAARWVLPDE